MPNPTPAPGPEPSADSSTSDEARPLADSPANDAESTPAGTPASDAASAPASSPASDAESLPADSPASTPAGDAVRTPAGSPESDAAHPPASAPASSPASDVVRTPADSPVASPAKEAILGRIRTALADRPAPAPIPREYQRTRAIPDVVGLAAERIADYLATVHRTDADGLPGLIAARLVDQGLRTIAAPAGIPETWRVEGVTWLVDSPASPVTVPDLDTADGVLTGAALAIAETGTIVLDAGPASGRRVITLVPDYHLCVLRADQIVGTVPEAIAALGADRPVTFVSGPSATSDIEFNRVEGVHGPRTLDVIIVD